MLSLASLLTFSLRALIVLLVLSVLWVNVAGPYNHRFFPPRSLLGPSGRRLSTIIPNLQSRHPCAGTPCTMVPS